MQFSIVSVLAFAAAALAQVTCNANCFSESTSGTINYKAGDSVPLMWTNKEGNTVTIKLAYGSRDALTVVSTIAMNLPNTGSFTWQIDPNLPQRVDYALEITNDDNDETNYSSQFDILNPNNISSNPASSATDSATVTGTDSTTATVAATTTGTDSAVTGSATTGASTMNTQTTGASSTKPASTTAAPPTVPTGTGNAASRPAIGAVGGLLAVAAGFAIAL